MRRIKEEYRAVGNYLELDAPHKLAFSFRMPQFNDLEDTLTVHLERANGGTAMTYVQNIVVPLEEGLTEEEIAAELKASSDGNKQGFHYMFMGLQQLVETGKVSWPG